MGKDGERKIANKFFSNNLAIWQTLVVCLHNINGVLVYIYICDISMQLSVQVVRLPHKLN